MRPSASPISPSAQRSQKPSAPRAGVWSFGVETRERDRLARREIGRDAADRADLALDVVEPDVAFGGGVEFEHAERPEAILESAPDLAGKPVADRQPQLVRLLGRGRAGRRRDSGRVRRYTETPCNPSARRRPRSGAPRNAPRSRRSRRSPAARRSRRRRRRCDASAGNHRAGRRRSRSARPANQWVQTTMRR